ncbi:MAG: DUF1684 domain-containing protein [Deltaproteobacteria bacterium]|nr:DUF1684 domain-containing protein [Deltaproteobacteria bacterium]
MTVASSGEAGEYQRGVEAARALRVQRLLAPDGWLALVARHWLEEGETELPIGFVTLKDGAVHLRVHTGVEARVGGKLIKHLDWVGDDAPRPDVVEALGQRWDLVRRGERLSLRVKDEASALRRNFAGIDYFPIDPRWAVTGRFESYQGKFLDVVSSSGLPLRLPCPGRVVFTLEGRELALEPMMDGARLQFIFADQTSKHETYGGGRFLYAGFSPEGVTLDFNLALNPPCVFNPLAVCPLPPAQNRLPLRIEAGERVRG